MGTRAGRGGYSLPLMPGVLLIWMDHDVLFKNSNMVTVKEGDMKTDKLAGFSRFGCLRTFNQAKCISAYADSVFIVGCFFLLFF